jgi:hypothetical protein
MKTKTALGVIAATLVAACTSTPRWDTSVFPQQPVYAEGPLSDTPVATTVAEGQK